MGEFISPFKQGMKVFTEAHKCLNHSLMEIAFVPMLPEHRVDIIDIFNYYVNNGFSTYPDQTVPYGFFDRFLEMTKDYPAFSIMVKDQIVGFCFLRAYNPLANFKECAEISYFIDNAFTGKGIGKKALDKLEAAARLRGIKTILASITSPNHQSLAFHRNNGFIECGRFRRILKKREEQFDIVWMQKWIDREGDGSRQ